MFLYRREDEPLRRLLLDDAGRAEIDRLWSELEFVSEQALATPIAYEGLVQYYRKPNDGARIMFFYIQEFEQQIKKEEKAFLAAQVAAEPRHLEALLAFAAGPGAGLSPPMNFPPFLRPTKPIVKTASSTIRLSVPLLRVSSRLPGSFIGSNNRPP